MKNTPKVGSQFMRDFDAKIFVCVDVYDNKFSTSYYILKDEKKGTLYQVKWDYKEVYSTCDAYSEKTEFHLMEV